MSYTKTNWCDGDIITAVKMNKIENGIESSLSDALVTLGKALCGDSFEVESGLTDAETILEIAKNYTGGSGSGGGGDISLPFPIITVDADKVVMKGGMNAYEVTSHSWEELCAISQTFGFPQSKSPMIIHNVYTDPDSGAIVGEYNGFYYPTGVDTDNEDEVLIIYMSFGGGSGYSSDRTGVTAGYYIDGDEVKFEPPLAEDGNPTALFTTGMRKKITVTNS